ncbi:hypothetical protein RYX36_013477 [Vicia faba]
MMTDHQRIHPANDLESQTKPTIPLYPRNTSKYDGCDPPIPKRHFPVRHSQPPKKKRSCCCRFLCCTFTILLVLIIAISITIGTLYLVFRPKLPKYSVDRLRIAQFNLSDNNNLFVTFDVTVTARNPNKKIGIYYNQNFWLTAIYASNDLENRRLLWGDIVNTHMNQLLCYLITLIMISMQSFSTIQSTLELDLILRMIGWFLFLLLLHLLEL